MNYISYTFIYTLLIIKLLNRIFKQEKVTLFNLFLSTKFQQINYEQNIDILINNIKQEKSVGFPRFFLVLYYIDII